MELAKEIMVTIKAAKDLISLNADELIRHNDYLETLPKTFNSIMDVLQSLENRLIEL